METSYTPVQYVFREMIEEEIAKQRVDKIFFFNKEGKVDEVQGAIAAIADIPGSGLFVTMQSGAQVRIDRIITLFGQPGAAYTEYDEFANACMECDYGFQAD